MACELFDDGRLARCNAVAGLLIPSHHERERYCRSDENHACPTYRLYQLRGTQLPQEVYYALWVPPVPQAPSSEEEPIAQPVIV